MGIFDKARQSVYKPIARATADYLREAARQDLEKASSATVLGPPIRRSIYDANAVNNGLRTKPGSAVSFETLRRFSKNHEISRICINARKRQITSLNWDIIPADPEDKTDYTNEINLIKSYFKNLGGYRMRFRELQDTLIEDLLCIDAAVLYKQKNRVGDILYYMPVDGTTIKLRVDESGNTPMPPEPAYIQFIRGTQTGEYTADQMIYEMMNPRTDTPYGLAPLESLVLIVSSSLKGTLYNLDYLTAGNVPEGFLKMPEDWSTKQIEEFMNYFDALMSGNSQETTKVKAITGDYIATKKRDDMAFKDFNNWLMKITCAMFDVQPQEIGFTETVNRSTGKEQNDISTRRGILPLANLLKEIWDDIIQIDLGYPELQFKYLGLEDRDQLADAQTKQVLLNSGVQTVDEVRKEMGLDPIGVVTPYVLGAPVFLTQAKVLGTEETPIDEEGDISATEAHDTDNAESGSSKLMPDDSSKTVEAELRKFKTYAVKRLKEGKKLRKFSSDVLAPELIDTLNKALVHCDNPEAAKRVIETIGRTPSFLAKAADGGDYQPNPYFEELIASKAFKNFELDFRKAIKSQAEWTSSQLEEVESQILGEDLKLSTDQVAELEAYLYDNMPSISTYVDESLVVAWYIKVVNDSVSGLYKTYSSAVNFDLRSEAYISQLKNSANLILTKSSLDNTTRKQLADLIIQNRVAGMTWQEIAKDIDSKFTDISKIRAKMIAYTETANTMNAAQYNAMAKAGVQMKEWLGLGPNICPICLGNVGDGPIPIDSMFSSGDLMPSAHVFCECGLDYVVGDISPESFWDGE